jgi:hypothetical protein
MKNTLHTSGPWQVSPYGNITRKSLTVAKVEQMPGNYESERMANAQLISASPDLLAAVDSCLEIMLRAIGERLPINRGTECEETDWQTAIRKAKSALAKAKGEA